MSAPRIAERLSRQLTWEDLDVDAIRMLISLARKEDLLGWGLSVAPQNTGDITSACLPSARENGSASLVARQDLIVCGLPVVNLVVRAYGETAVFEPSVTDGTSCPAGTLLGVLKGPVQVLLEAERVILNFLQRLCGVATLTAVYVKAMGDTTTRLLDTRKTTPGYRVLEKYAVACGGGYNHRMGLFDRVMLKDNHLAANKATYGRSLSELVAAYRQQWPDMIIELEVDSLKQIGPALDAGIENIMIDNFSVKDTIRAVDLVGDKAAIEASGGITLESLGELARLGLDFISTGATVHQATWKDIGLDWN